MTMTKGNFLVIEGSDGAGKATQTDLLVKRLRAEGRRVETIDFPRYYVNHMGKLLRECLDGKRGDFLSLDPQITSLIYAADRFESSKQIRQWLEEGADVVADRYVSANMLHQGSKIDDEETRAEFFNWLDRTEHGVFEIPRPDIIVYLDVPYEARKKMMEEDVTRGALDTVEVDEGYQTAHEKSAEHLNRIVDSWHHILCAHEKGMRTREDIHEDVYKKISELIHSKIEVIE
jgi:dTMP kinase